MSRRSGPAGPVEEEPRVEGEMRGVVGLDEALEMAPQGLATASLLRGTRHHDPRCGV